MAELQLIQNDHPVRRYPLSQGGISIGRAPDNQIQLDSPAVEQRHARIFTVGHSSVIQNLSTESGTYINNQEVTRQTLRHDDVVQIGSFQLRFLAEDAKAEKAAAQEEMAPEPEAAVAATLLNDATATQAEQPAPAPPVPTQTEVEAEPAGINAAEAESAGSNETSDDLHAAVTDTHDRETAASTEPALEDLSPQPQRTERINTELKAKAVENTLDDFESTLSSELDVDLIADSQTLLQSTEELLTEDVTAPAAYAPGDPADEPKPIDDYGEPIDEMAGLLTDDTDQGSESTTLKLFTDNDRSDDTSGTPTGSSRDDAEPDTRPAAARAVTPSYVPPETDVRGTEPAEEADDPVAAAIRARIEAKVKANAHLLNEIEPIEIKEVRAETLSTEEHNALEERFTREIEAEEDAHEPAPVKEDDAETTILEFLPEPRHLTSAEQKLAASKAEATGTTRETPAPQASRRQASIELPAPPSWTVEGDESAPTEVLTLQGGMGNGAKYGAIDILHGPNAGLRVWLGKPRTILGNNQDRAVIIERHATGFRVTGMPRGSTVTVNGTLLLSTPENLQNGDMIEFANMGLKFVLSDVRPSHPDELALDNDANENAEGDAAIAENSEAETAANEPTS